MAASKGTQTINPLAGPFDVALRVPGSKSLTNRALVLGVEPYDGKNYDTGQVLPAGAPVVRPDGEIWFYYAAHRFNLSASDHRKYDGARERFSREKLESGINTACEQRPLNADALEQTIREIENELYDEFAGEVQSKAIGGKVMAKLKKLDGVAYVRFASVYWRFDDAAEFLEAVQKFGTRDDTATIKLPGF